jgi:hypothetical protein
MLNPHAGLIKCLAHRRCGNAKINLLTGNTDAAQGT